MRQEKSRIDDIERQPEFRGKQALRGIGNLALNFLQTRLPALRGTRGRQGLSAPNVFEAEYKVLGETDLPSTEGILSLPAGPPVPFVITTSGSYNQTFTNAAGCDSVHTLVATINYSNTGTSSVTACDSYTWMRIEHLSTR